MAFSQSILVIGLAKLTCHYSVPLMWMVHYMLPSATTMTQPHKRQTILLSNYLIIKTYYQHVFSDARVRFSVFSWEQEDPFTCGMFKELENNGSIAVMGYHSA